MSSARLREASTTRSDAAIMERLAAGEIGALGALYDRHNAAVRHFLVQATAGADDVDDLVQATFLTAAKIAARFDGRAASRPWLVGIAVRLLRRRSSAFGRLAAALSRLRTNGRPSLDPRNTLDLRSDLSRALATISEAKRITLVMAEVEGLSCAEIAEILDVPIGTVWTRLHAARRDLRATLEENVP